MFILGIIPARAGSKTIKDKNIKKLNGTPMIQYTVDAANFCVDWDNPITNCSFNYVISTDDKRIIRRYSREYHVINRPIELAQDDTTMMPVIMHAVEEWESTRSAKVDAVCLLQPTSPLRNCYDLITALSMFIQRGASSLYSGYNMRIKYKDKLDCKGNEEHFQRNGAIFITRRDLLHKGKLWDDDVVEMHMLKDRSIDIDSMQDFLLADAILQYKGYQK